MFILPFLLPNMILINFHKNGIRNLNALITKIYWCLYISTVLQCMPSHIELIMYGHDKTKFKFYFKTSSILLKSTNEISNFEATQTYLVLFDISFQAWSEGLLFKLSKDNKI